MNLNDLYCFAVETFDPFTDKRKADEFMQITNRTVGMVGVHPHQRGILMIYDTLGHAEEAWTKFSDGMRTGNYIMHAKLTCDMQNLTITTPAKAMRLTDSTAPVS